MTQWEQENGGSIFKEAECSELHIDCTLILSNSEEEH